MAPTDPSLEPKRQAVVIGGGIAGLLAARVLTDHFDRVVLVERDRLPARPTPRRGAPQARHVHVLLQRGLLVLEQLFPGLSCELGIAGATSLDAAADLAWLTSAGWACSFRSGIPMLSATRDLLEWSIRRRLDGVDRLCRIEAVMVTGLLSDAPGHVTGVSLRPRDDLTAGGEQRLPADLVVDASGRSSRTPQWLVALGYPAPDETVVDVGLCYASRIYRRAAGAAATGWQGLLLQPAPPDRRRGGLMLPIEGDRWIVTLSGRGGEQPPVDEAGFLGYARTLRSPLIYEAISGAEPLSSIVGYRATANRLRHYERLARSPEGLVVLGDAACAFNPVYGQGMTIAALSALLLGDCLAARRRRGKVEDELQGLARAFQQRLAKLTAMPWLSATSEDRRYLPPGTASPGGWRTRMMHRYLDRLTQYSTHDAEVRRVLIEVFNLVRPPTALFTPRLVLAGLGRG